MIKALNKRNWSQWDSDFTQKKTNSTQIMISIPHNRSPCDLDKLELIQILLRQSEQESDHWGLWQPYMEYESWNLTTYVMAMALMYSIR